jgi:hypothetical protein
MDIAVRVHYTPRRSSETVLEKLPGIGIITRNRYGAEILNADTVMFVDWDVPFRNTHRYLPKPRGFIETLRRTLLGPTSAQRQIAQQALDAWARSRKTRLENVVIGKARELEIGLRLYETRNGLRAIVTSSQFNPSDQTAQDLMTYLGADKLYVRLCRIQNTFRARLTPKFWRIGMSHRPLSKPPENPDAGERMWRWFEEYRIKCDAFATARFISQTGPNTTDPVILELIHLHDTRCKVTQHLELA